MTGRAGRRTPTSRVGPEGRGRPCDEDGLAAGAEALVFGVLIFVLGTLLFVNAWAVIDTKFATSAAAREAVRVAVETPAGVDPAVRAATAARATLDAHGLDGDAADVEAPGGWAGQLERCQEVELAVTYRVDAVGLPVIGRRTAGFEVTGRHTEVIDPFRSGLAIGGTCGF